VSTHRAGSRVAGLDGLRGLAALAVLVLHVSFYTARARPPWDVGDGLLQGLRLGVVLFFALSGFLLVRPWLRAARGQGAAPDVTEYLVRRAARVLPCYYVALALGAVVLIGTGNDRLPHVRDLPALLLLVQNWSPDLQEKLVPPAWTLAIEVSFYLVLPIAGVLLLRFGTTARRQLALALAAAATSIGFNALVAAWLPAQWHRTLPGTGYAFALGAAAAVLAENRRPNATARAFLIADALADKTWHAPGMVVIRDLPAAAGFAALLLAVASGKGRVLDSPPLRWLGSRSYALYLVHYPVILLFTARDALPSQPLPATLRVLAIALVLSEGLTRFVEQPIARRARNRSTVPARVRVRGPWRAGESPASEAAT
jgi:peptidoglycan/LPS O-acetylase OafA/YrhL